MTIAQMTKNWANLNLYKEAEEVVLSMQEELAELNREQLREGERSDRTKIRPKYTKKYQAYKTRKKGYTLDGTPNLMNEGNFYKGFVTRIKGVNKYSIDSNDSKTSKLVDRYSYLIFGLTNESKYFIQPKVQTKLVERIESKVLK